jgi:hypothetical protein
MVKERLKGRVTFRDLTTFEKNELVYHPTYNTGPSLFAVQEINSDKAWIGWTGNVSRMIDLVYVCELKEIVVEYKVKRGKIKPLDTVRFSSNLVHVVNHINSEGQACKTNGTPICTAGAVEKLNGFTEVTRRTIINRPQWQLIVDKNLFNKEIEFDLIEYKGTEYASMPIDNKRVFSEEEVLEKLKDFSVEKFGEDSDLAKLYAKQWWEKNKYV